MSAPPARAPLARVLGWLLRPRLRRVAVLVAVLLAVLGFGAAVQVRSTQVDGVLASARTEDLVQILDDVQGRSDRLRQEVDDLRAALERLAGAGGDEAALEEARRRTQLLGVLAGTVAATGPGVTLRIEGQDAAVRAEVLLDSVQELRDAGAEAVQVAGAAGAPVRVVASTAFVDEGARVLVDGVALSPPYVFTVVGEPGTLASALAIPGGVVGTVARRGGTATVTEGEGLVVGALRPLQPPRYARPAPGG